MFSQTKICFTRSRLHRKMTKIRLSRIESSAFKISSYAGPSVDVPQAEDYQSLTKAEKDKMGDTFYGKSDTKVERGSIFQGYAVAVNEINDVKLAYIQLKKCFPKMAHIICAFRMAHLTDLANQDYVEDGEDGGGRTLLNVLIDMDIRNKALFVTSHHGGENLGGRRFDLIKQVDKMR